MCQVLGTNDSINIIQSVEKCLKKELGGIRCHEKYMVGSILANPKAFYKYYILW